MQNPIFFVHSKDEIQAKRELDTQIQKLQLQAIIELKMKTTKENYKV